ncbi:TetR/AcrR family transcriptional regulator [Facklamia miroungae]|uniref:DNA-binding transcriptional regulator, AcrR family n=1 Tax=Facklamia miroungae TaxID=120956 RepID=A0A1G7TBW6_9LACT|nr:TetR/AcrR family transcriptional regulator [Facklamia miroungae]NKZ29758.1 TetR/AcrR family transcriptional regulator [Facklamia miroungae]SDG32788.1 DNA-binding transcriptional regulator, AcrR family [Facklamia miroungae]
MARNKFPEETIKQILDVASELFLEKGYDNTSLQDIIDKTHLSKGAIYHHFKSKEDIFESICDRLGEENAEMLAKIRNDQNLNGIEKLQKLFKTALDSMNHEIALTLSPNLLDNPRFLAMEIKQIYEIVAPQFIEPILEEGISDRSIEVEYPAETAEAIMILSNIWLNPLARNTKADNTENRFIVFNNLLTGIGIKLMDDELMDKFISTSLNKK